MFGKSFYLGDLKMKTIGSAAVLAIIGGAASAGTVHETFYFVGHRGLNYEIGGAYTYEENGLNVSATGHLLNEDGSIGAARYIGEYGYQTG